MNLKDCIHGGGKDCRRHGGDGSTLHKAGFIHPFRSHEEVFKAGAVSTRSVVTQVESLEADLQDTALLYDEPIEKALYHFDVETPAGIDRLLELLPILDREIIEEVYQEIWPNYPTDDEESFNLRIARAEIRGYLMDFLIKHDVGTNEKPTEVTIEDLPEAPQPPDEEETEVVGDIEQGDQEADEGGIPGA